MVNTNFGPELGRVKLQGGNQAGSMQELCPKVGLALPFSNGGTVQDFRVEPGGEFYKWELPLSGVFS